MVGPAACGLILLGACGSQIVSPTGETRDPELATDSTSNAGKGGAAALGNSRASTARPDAGAPSSSGAGRAGAGVAGSVGRATMPSNRRATGGIAGAAETASSAGTRAMGGAGSGATQTDAGVADAGSTGIAGAGEPKASRIQHVFVIAMENHDEGSIVGNTKDAKYINNELLPKYASGSNFLDRLAISIVSEPHYVWMEAGTNSFSDHTFSSDDAPSASNSTASGEHLVTQLTAKGLTWVAYQEGIDGTSGACPIQASGYYQPKHDPFIFFRDVSGNPPSKSKAECVAHHKEYGKLAADLKNRNVANYNFITPNQCHDMHGQSGCPNSNTIQAGDDWLRANLPQLITFVDANDGVIFIVWDEGESSRQIPFLAVGARVKSHYVSAVEYDHGSLVRSLETIFDLSVLPKVSAANDFRDLFNAGQFP